MNKRGLSSAIEALIIIILVIMVVGTFQNFIMPFLGERSIGEIFLGKGVVSLDIEKVIINNNSFVGGFTIVVKRNKGGESLSKIKFIASDGMNSEVFERTTNIKELENQAFSFTLTEIEIKDLTEISIAPIFKLESGEESLGNPVAFYKVKGNEMTDCVPFTCETSGYECGGWDDGCGGTFYCESCSFGICSFGFCE